MEAKYHPLIDVTRKDETEATMDDYRNAVSDLHFKSLVIDWDTFTKLRTLLQNERIDTNVFICKQNFNDHRRYRQLR